MKYALVCLLYERAAKLGFANPHCVVLFDSELEAYKFAAQSIVHSGDAKRLPSGMYEMAGQRYDTITLVYTWAGSLDQEEYYIVVPVEEA